MVWAELSKSGVDLSSLQSAKPKRSILIRFYKKRECTFVKLRAPSLSFFWSENL